MRRAASNGATRRPRDHLGIDPQRDMLQLIGNLVRDPGFTAYYAGNDYSRMRS